MSLINATAALVFRNDCTSSLEWRRMSSVMPYLTLQQLTMSLASVKRLFRPGKSIGSRRANEFVDTNLEQSSARRILQRIDYHRVL